MLDGRSDRTFHLQATALVAMVATGACKSGSPGSDLGADAAFDATTDLTGDGRRLDGPGQDAAVDSGCASGDLGSCMVGRACAASSCGCAPPLTCQPAVGGTPVFALDVYDCSPGPGADGGIIGSIDHVYYPDGYCTNATLGAPNSILGASGACNPSAASDDPAMAGIDGCPSCAKCVAVHSGDPTASAYVQCQQRCVPSPTDNGGCRNGYTCDVFSRSCTPFSACQTDIECQVYKEDSNGDGLFDLATGDRYCRDSGSATCDLITGRCRGAGLVGSTAGSACSRDSECESGGHCLTSLEGYPGGYCSSYGCELPGLACPDVSDKCERVGLGFLCLMRCTVGAEDASLVLGSGGHGDTCRPGYQCLYDGSSGAGVMGNGGCWLGEYNAITTNNVGSGDPPFGTCTSDDQCYSPHGTGRCELEGSVQVCRIIGCAGYVPMDDICGLGNVCLTLPTGDSKCAIGCVTDSDCEAHGAPAAQTCRTVVPGMPMVCWSA